MKRILKFILLILISAGATAQNTHSKQLDSNIFLLPIGGVNTIVCPGDNGILLVDGGYFQASNILSSYLDSTFNKKISIIINTHWHFDHVGANKAFGKEATIIAHENARKHMSNNEIVLGNPIEAHNISVLPNIGITNKLNLYLNGNAIEIIPLIGGHTNGDLLVYFPESKIVHVGDIIFSDMFPFIDIKHGGNVQTLIKNLGLLVDKFPDDTKFIPGHGRIYNKNDVKKYLETLKKSSKIIVNQIKNNKGIEEIDTDELLKEWASFEKGFTRKNWAEYIYESYK